MAAYETLTTGSRDREFNDPQADACRRLWQHQLLGTVMDAFGRKVGGGNGIDTFARNAARYWLTTPSDNFNMICTYAGINPAVVHHWAQQMQAEGWPLDQKKLAAIRRACGAESESAPRMREARAA